MRSWVALALVIGCGSQPKPLPDLTPDEIALRGKLGIPLDAEHVVVFGQNAHLDIDWQHTFDDYYQLYVENIFLQAHGILDAQPRAFYSVAEMAFLAHHLAVHPEEVAGLRAASDRGALRIVGGGMTSPDTLLPETELLARDYLYGIQFAEDTLDAHPTAAWLPDSFGHGAAAPDVLAAAGYTSVAFSRIDGAPGIFYQIQYPGIAPLPGSTAEQLQQLNTADFIWQGSGGAQILAHFLSGQGLYCQGDNLDYNELLETPGDHLGAFRGMDTTFTDDRIDGYIAQNQPYASTRYTFVPVGCDFQSPKDALIGYLDGYDSRRYHTSGVYAVAAPFEDYEALVGFHRDALPTVTQELSPYFMGFFGSRADIKRGVRDAARPFFVAEAFAALLGPAGRAIVAAAAPALTLLTRADHHDFVTGTSSDAVVTSEQLPLLAASLAAGQAELQQVAAGLAATITPAATATSRVLAFNAASGEQAAIAELDVPTSGGAIPAVHAVTGGTSPAMELIVPPATGDTVARFRVALDVPAFGYQAIDVVPGAAAPPASAVTVALLDATGQPATGAAVVRVVLANARVTARWDRTAGTFALTSLVIDGSEAIARPSMIVGDYQDDGGLWRLGNEMPGCQLLPIAPVAGSDTVQIVDQGALAVTVAFGSADATREATLTAGAPALDLAITTGAAMAHTRTVAFGLAVPAGAMLATSVPGGSAIRPNQRVFTPTFWAATSWAQVGGWAVLLRQSTGVRMDTAGALELFAVRDARQEACDIEGGTGSDTAVHRIEWRIAAAASPADAERAAQAFDRPLAIVPVDLTGSGATPGSGGLVTIAGAGIVSTVKPAERGSGVIVRAVLLPGPATIDLSALPHTQITVVDLAERDLRPVAATDQLVLDAATYGSIVSLRVQ